MAESSKRRKDSFRSTTAGRHQQPPSDDAPTPTNPTPYTGRALALFSSDEQRDRYYQLFFERNIVDPKYINIDFFEGESFECYMIFKNSGLVDFMSMKNPVYLELVRFPVHLFQPFCMASALLQHPLEQLFLNQRPHFVVVDAFIPWVTNSAVEFGIPNLPGEITMTWMHMPPLLAKLMAEATKLELRSYGVVVNPLSLCNNNTKEKENRVAYKCFGSEPKFPNDGFEKRMEGKGLIIIGWRLKR
uniref:Uncharacterized protein n=1 Tax=Cajanus cajan TaxID=3821 RepID=A0A151RJB0_CAJCA|nr:hypothetical protein KK1_036016 [Cajanus cajan]